MSNTKNTTYSGPLSPRERKALALVQLFIEATHNPEALPNFGCVAILALDIGNNNAEAINNWVQAFRHGRHHDKLKEGYAEAYREARNAGVSGFWLDSFYTARNESNAGV